MGGKIAASGDVTSLINGVGGDVAMLTKSCLYMFTDCTALTTAPNLPSTTLAQSCYYAMFDGCSSLKVAPKLPATTLAQSCYSYMFADCSSLIAPPELPATTLAANCYNFMFYECKSLTKLPALNATYLPDACYCKMFYHCENIRLSTTDAGYGSWSLPSNVTVQTNAILEMLGACGEFSGTPTIGTTYYYMTPICTIFKSDASFSVTPNGTWDGTLQYSTDTLNWMDVTKGSAINSSSDTFEIWFRGKDNTVITGGNYPWTLTPTEGHGIAVKGNIMLLMDYEFPDGKTILTEDEFWDDEEVCDAYSGEYDSYLEAMGVVSESDFESDGEYSTYEEYLAAKEKIQLGESAFAYMFCGQTSLVSMPELSAKNLGNNCYAHMFENSGIKIGTSDKELGQWDGIPSDATGGEGQFTDIFKGTGGTFTGTPTLGSAYYYEKLSSFDAEPKTYSVTLSKDGGTCSDVTSYTYGVGIALPIPTKEHYTFDGWYTNISFDGDAVIEIAELDSGDKTYYAKWTFEPYAEAIIPTDAENYPQIQGGIDKTAGVLRFIWQFKFYGEPIIDNFGAYIIPYDLFNDCKDTESVIVNYTDKTPSDGETFSADITNIPSEKLGTQILAVPFINGVFGTQIYTTTVNEFLGE